MRTVGTAAITLGLVGVGITGLLYQLRKDDMQQSEFDQLKTWNTASWIVTGLGAGSVGLSFLVGSGGRSTPTGPNEKPLLRKRQKAQIYGGFGLGSLWLRGEL
jgi:hypothetical protein